MLERNVIPARLVGDNRYRAVLREEHALGTTRKV